MIKTRSDQIISDPIISKADKKYILRSLVNLCWGGKVDWGVSNSVKRCAGRTFTWTHVLQIHEYIIVHKSMINAYRTLAEDTLRVSARPAEPFSLICEICCSLFYILDIFCITRYTEIRFFDHCSTPRDYPQKIIHFHL